MIAQYLIEENPTNLTTRLALKYFPYGKLFEFESHLFMYDPYVTFEYHLIRKRDLKVYEIVSICCIVFYVESKPFQDRMRLILLISSGLILLMEQNFNLISTTVWVLQLCRLYMTLWKAQSSSHCICPNQVIFIVLLTLSSHSTFFQALQSGWDILPSFSCVSSSFCLLNSCITVFKEWGLWRKHVSSISFDLPQSVYEVTRNTAWFFVN